MLINIVLLVTKTGRENGGTRRARDEMPAANAVDVLFIRQVV
jgi:hypothetical protein